MEKMCRYKDNLNMEQLLVQTEYLQLHRHLSTLMEDLISNQTRHHYAAYPNSINSKQDINKGAFKISINSNLNISKDALSITVPNRSHRCRHKALAAREALTTYLSYNQCHSSQHTVKVITQMSHKSQPRSNLRTIINTITNNNHPHSCRITSFAVSVRLR